MGKFIQALQDLEAMKAERDAAREALRELLEIYQEGVGFSHTALTQVTREKVRAALEGSEVDV